MPWCLSGCATLSLAFMSGSKLPSWKINDTVFCLRCTNCLPLNRVIFLPASITEPELGFINPPRHFINVDLPEPEGPTTAIASPCLTSMWMPRSATTLPSSALD